MRISQLGRRVVDVFARPANVTQYAANDVIAASESDSATSGLRPLALASDPGKPFWLTYFSLATNKTDFPCTVRVHLYSVAKPTTAIAGDNVTFVQYYANVAQRLGSFDLPTLALQHAGDDYVFASRDDLRLLLVPANVNATNDEEHSIYYRLEIVSGTPTPSSGQSFTVRAVASDN